MRSRWRGWPAAERPEHRRRRRARLGARPQRPLRRGAARYSQARPAARHARRAQALPPRDDRALPRRPTRRETRSCAGRWRSTRTSRFCGRPSRGGRSDEAARRCSPWQPRRSRSRRSPSAHPLGNFTINRFSRVEVSGPRLYVRYVLDMAEIPTFQAGASTRSAYARRIARNAHLVVDGQPRGARPGSERRSRIRSGAGGLRTTRLEVVLAGPRAARTSAIAYHDDNYADRIGWKEIVVGAERAEHAARAPRLPEEPPPEPARHDLGHGRRSSPGGGPDVAPALSSGTSLQARTGSPTPASRRSSAART